ncbi:MAG: site-specific DNA-methyltransferase, partial [Chloroflexi bacterium]
MARKRSKGSKRPIEAYQHTEHKRLNNPPAGLVTPETDPEGGKKSYRYDPHLDPELNFDSRKIRDELTEVIEQGLKAETLDQAKEALKTLKKAQEPYLNWAGKAEHTSFEVPTVSLHVHERIEPCTIIEAVRRRNGEQPSQPSLFKLEEKPLRQAIEFYKHKEGWKNRLIAGDSLLVMNSLLEKEGMAGKVQMIYIDPPYGIKYASNFQPFVNKRDVKDKDEDLTTEPELIKAFRDTWELGIHSYLTYLRDRLLLARELLTESGSIFVQINDENLHLVRCLLDEVFGRENFVAVIPFRKKTMPFGTKGIEQMDDFLVWYSKDKEQVKYRPLFVEQSVEGDWHYQWGAALDGEVMRLTKAQVTNHALIPEGVKLFRLKSLEPSGRNESGFFDYGFQGKIYRPPRNGYAISKTELDRVRAAERLALDGRRLAYILYADDYPVAPLTAPWQDTIGPRDKYYAVQTAEQVIDRCILMTTDPGDLVFDPTCGSGTTAYCAEKWGRRWITCDTSRVAIAIARQRLMTAVFDYYELAHPEEGVSGGFKYKTVPHITLKSIAHNEEIDAIAAKYQPQIDQALVDLNRALGEGWKEWEVPRLRPHPLWPDEVKKAWDLLQSKRDEEAALGNPPAEVQAALETLNHYFGEKYTLATLPDPV